MNNKSLQFKLMAGGVVAVVIPLILIGGFSIYRSMTVLQETAMSRSVDVAKGLAHMASIAVDEELKIVSQVAQRGLIVDASMKYAAGEKNAPEIARMTADMIQMKKGNEKEYEAFLLLGMDGNVISSEGSKINLAERDYFKTAKEGKVNAGSVVKSVSSGNTVLAFAAPVRSKTNEVIGVVISIANIGFLADKISATKLGQTGYGFVIDKTGMTVAHPNRDFILKVNIAEQEGMKELAARMTAGETNTLPYAFKGVRKIAGFAPVSQTGWSICLTQNFSEFMAPAYGMMVFNALVGLVLIILTVAAIFVLSRKVAGRIGNIAHELQEASEQVASDSAQVSQASQSLAEGATEQASALEETSSSLEEMSSMTQRNADNAVEARGLMTQAKDIIDKVDGQMNTMTASILDVTKSSEETGKIIKTIDEIAFQTNLLALNAAVEAARAGEAGAGFAVVADEVRNLAVRAADAAKHTAGLIEKTIATVHNSRDLTEQTQRSFKENVDISARVVSLIAEIAAASQEQAQGIGQISKAVAEMDKVVQRTAASAEESASAAEEMNAQSQQMKVFVKHLRYEIHGSSVGGGSAEMMETDSGRSLLESGH